jgi:hypothetical protein
MNSDSAFAFTPAAIIRGGVRVPGIVDRKRRGAGLAHRRTAALDHLARSGGPAEHLRPVVGHPALHEVVAQHGGDRYAAEAVAALWFDLARDGVPAAPDVDHPASQVHVVPAQADSSPRRRPA